MKCLDVAEVELCERQSDRTDAQDVLGIGRSTRRVTDANYDCTTLTQPPGIRNLLEVYFSRNGLCILFKFILYLFVYYLFYF